MKINFTKFDELEQPERQKKFYPIPTNDVMKSVLARYEQSERCAEEKKIIALFQQYPLNTDKTDVMLKATALRSFMGRSAMYLNFATHYILSDKDFDRKLQRGSQGIVDAISSTSKAKWKYVEFACSYCAFHQPEHYLFSNWSLILRKYDWLYEYLQGSRIPFSTRYPSFWKPFRIFREYFHLQQYPLPDIQHFFFQLRHEEMAEFDRYCLDKDSQRISRNRLVVGMVKGRDDE